MKRRGEKRSISGRKEEIFFWRGVVQRIGDRSRVSGKSVEERTAEGS